MALSRWFLRLWVAFTLVVFASIPALTLTLCAVAVQLTDGGASLAALWRELEEAVHFADKPVYGLVAEEELVTHVTRGTGVWRTPYNSGERPPRQYTLTDVPDRALLREGALYIRPQRIPKRGACAYVKGRPKTNGGGAGFATRAPFTAYLCCARHYGLRRSPRGEGWEKAQETARLGRHAGAPCRWWRKELAPGHHEACCGDSWGTGVLLVPAGAAVRAGADEEEAASVRRDEEAEAVAEAAAPAPLPAEGGDEVGSDDDDGGASAGGEGGVGEGGGAATPAAAAGGAGGGAPAGAPAADAEPRTAEQQEQQEQQAAAAVASSAVAPAAAEAALRLFGGAPTAHSEASGVTVFGGEEVVRQTGTKDGLAVWRRHWEPSSGMLQASNGETVRYALSDLPPELRAAAAGGGGQRSWYVRPERLPTRGACVANSNGPGSRGGGATLSVARRMTAYFCCANHVEEAQGAARRPVGEGWSALPGKYELAKHAFKPCTFFKKVLEPGELHVACCADVWGTGVLLEDGAR